MSCEDANNLLNARLDGELADAARLDEHLATCAACRAVAAELAAADEALDHAFVAPRRAAVAVADRVVAMLRDQGLNPDIVAQTGGPSTSEGFGGQTRMSTPPKTSKAFCAKWGRPLLAAAAGFLLAILITRPWQKQPATPIVQVPSPPATTTHPIPATTAAARPIAQLALATGAVYICPQGSQDWRPLETGGAVAAGMKVRTGPKVFCEFKMDDGSEVRLNTQTEVTLAAVRRVDVTAGRIFSSVRKAPDPFVVSALPTSTTLTALGTAFDVSCSANGANCTVVEGSVKVESAAGQQNVVKGGESLAVAVDGRLADKKPVENLMQATRWVDEILVMKGRDNPELARRIDDIFAQLGHEKMWYLNAQEVRRLGDHCVVPLTRYIQSDRSKATPGDQMKRREAARIIGDVATTRDIPELINLLADEDGDVRHAGALALQRLTGSDQGRPPQQWRDQSLMTCAPSVEQWHTWWQKNKSRYPGTDPDAVQPVQIAKERYLPKKG